MHERILHYTGEESVREWLKENGCPGIDESDGYEVEIMDYSDDEYSHDEYSDDEYSDAEPSQ